jgi:hypothetical protein
MSKFTKLYHVRLPTMYETSPPPVSIMTRLKKVEAEGADLDIVKPESIRYEILFDKCNSETRFLKEFSILKGESPEEYIKYLIGYRVHAFVLGIMDSLGK